jgi:hypothetical protein
LGEFRFPKTENVGREFAQAADFADAEIQLFRNQYVFGFPVRARLPVCTHGLLEISGFLIPNCRPDCLHKCYAISSMDSTPETTPELKEPAQ